MIEYQNAWAELRRRGASAKCPLCKHDKWMAGFGELSNLLVLLPGVSSSGALAETDAGQAGFPAYVFVCSNCGFLRLHAKHTLDTPGP